MMLLCLILEATLHDLMYLMPGEEWQHRSTLVIQGLEHQPLWPLLQLRISDLRDVGQCDAEALMHDCQWHSLITLV